MGGVVSAWARPGVKCVYIGNPQPNEKWRGVNRPVVGTVYTVRDVLLTARGTTAIWLVEIINPSVYVRDVNREMEWGFKATSFRPLITRTQEQDVSLFTHHLDGLPVGADA